MARTPGARRKYVTQSCVRHGNSHEVVTIGIHLKSEANERGFSRWKAGRIKEQRMMTRAALNAYSAMKHATRVRFIRLGPRLLDSDNLAGAAKAVRDEVAAYMGVDDGPKGPVTWEYDQQQSAAYGVIVELCG